MSFRVSHISRNARRQAFLARRGFLFFYGLERTAIRKQPRYNHVAELATERFLN
jgi:hypothetical protein